MLLGRPVKDIDITTSAHPEEVIRVFDKTVPTGLAHGTVTVIMPKHAFEVTTFRTESAYELHRRPASVEFVGDVGMDLARRDFTINAMAMDDRGALIDPYGGQEDIRRKRIRCVGNADERFQEDALRMMRCVRFAANYGYEAAYSTWKALLHHRGLLKHIAMERIRSELDRIMEGSDPDRGIGLLERSRLLRHTKVDLELPPSGCKHTNLMLAELHEAELRWSCLLMHLNVDASSGKRLLERLTFSKTKIVRICKLLEIHESVTGLNEDTELLQDGWKLNSLQYGQAALLEWLQLMHHENKCTQSNLMRNASEAVRARIAVLRSEGEHWLDEVQVRSFRELQVTGDELVRHLGPELAGPRVGAALRMLLEQAALGRIANRKQDLIEYAIKHRELIFS